MRGQFIGSAHDWERLAREHRLRCNTVGTWKGIGTVLLVVSTFSGGPVEDREQLARFREAVAEWSPVNCLVTVVSVG